MIITMFVGFWFTYFRPISQGTYPPVSPLVHVHGWTFFAWYLLLGAQAGLVRSGRVSTHRALGLATTALAAVMIVVGLIVSTVRVDFGLGPDGDPFWAFMGLPIFAIWILFTGFYLAAFHYRRRPADHKRYILLASAAALSAATFRIVIQVLGFTEWTAIIGFFAPTVFIFAAMIDDYRSLQTVHRVYASGVTAIFALMGVTFLLVMNPGGDSAKEAVAWVGRSLSPLY